MACKKIGQIIPNCIYIMVCKQMLNRLKEFGFLDKTTREGE